MCIESFGSVTISDPVEFRLCITVTLYTYGVMDMTVNLDIITTLPTLMKTC